MEKKVFTRDQKISYYMNKIQCLEFAVRELQANIKKHKDRLSFLQSDKYQDWNEEISFQIESKKRKKSG